MVDLRTGPHPPATEARTAGRAYPLTLPPALLSGAAPTALAGAVQYARDALADPASHLARNLLSFGVPGRTAGRLAGP